jgi:hypothetical protein
MKEGEDTVENTNTGLDMFQLKPRHLKGELLFHHMVQMHLYIPTLKVHDPSPDLDIKCARDELEEFGPHKTVLTSCKITTYSHSMAASMTLTTRKLDNLRYTR